MRYAWITRTTEAPAERLWSLVADPIAWPRWGPTVRAVAVDGDELGTGVTGTVRTVGGIRLPFEVTRFEPGRRWAWSNPSTMADAGSASGFRGPPSPTSWCATWP